MNLSNMEKLVNKMKSSGYVYFLSANYYALYPNDISFDWDKGGYVAANYYYCEPVNSYKYYKGNVYKGTVTSDKPDTYPSDGGQDGIWYIATDPS